MARTPRPNSQFVSHMDPAVIVQDGVIITTLSAKGDRREAKLQAMKLGWRIVQPFHTLYENLVDEEGNHAKLYIYGYRHGIDFP